MKMTLADVAAHQLRVEQGRRMKIDTAVSLLAEAKERDTKKKTARLQAANEKSESDIQQEIAEWLRSQRIFFVWHRTDRATTCQVGTPDFVGCSKQFGPFAIEVKKPGCKPTVAQEGQLMHANIEGMRAGIVHSLNEAVEFLAGKQISRTDSTKAQD